MGADRTESWFIARRWKLSEKPSFSKRFLHNAIADAAREAETIAASVPMPENVKFQRARGLIRAALTEAGVAQRIDALVARLLDGA